MSRVTRKSVLVFQPGPTQTATEDPVQPQKMCEISDKEVEGLY